MDGAGVGAGVGGACISMMAWLNCSKVTAPGSMPCARSAWPCASTLINRYAGALGTDFVRMSFTHPNKPVEFTGQESLDGEDSTHYRYLLVPIRFAS